MKDNFENVNAFYIDVKGRIQLMVSETVRKQVNENVMDCNYLANLQKPVFFS